MEKLPLGQQRWPRSLNRSERWALNRGLISHSFLQLFREFDYWPLNGGSTVYE